MQQQTQYKVGDVIKTQTHSGTVRYVRVQQKARDIKNGRPGWDGKQVFRSELNTGADRKCIRYVDGRSPFGCWGYDYQVLEVMRDAT